jgi:hypothetical protein
MPRSPISSVLPKLTGQSADFSIAYAAKRGAARIGRLIFGQPEARKQWPSRRNFISFHITEARERGCFPYR